MACRVPICELQGNCSCFNTRLNVDHDNNNLKEEISTCNKVSFTKESYLTNNNLGRVPFSNLIPQADTEALSHQTAGRTGVLKHRLGFVLKPVQKPPLGQREVNFYKSVYHESSSTNSDTQQILKDLIPRYFGVTNIECTTEDGSTIRNEYLMLEDIVQGFVEPCIVDVKIGVKTWDPLALPHKIEHERSKYVGTKGPLGMSITGMQVYDIANQRSMKLGKEFGKHLNTENISQAMKDFLNEKIGVHQVIAVKLLDKLNQIKKFFDSQTEHAFYASSLLIVYDADHAAKWSKNAQNVGNEGQGEMYEDWVRVKMIDFAHVFPLNGELDSNYIFGLGNLIRLVSAIAYENTA